MMKKACLISFCSPISQMIRLVIMEDRGGPKYKHVGVGTPVKPQCAFETYIKFLGPLKKIQ